MRGKGFLLASSCLALGFVGASPSQAWAQSAPEVSGESEEEIIVTARKREERLIDVPGVIQAFTGDQLAELGAETVQDIIALTPGVEFVQSTGVPGNSDIIIRGGGAGRFTNVDPSIGLYSNGAFVAGGNIGGRTLNASDLFDLERIEVLKGPQGALYGRNALGGSINAISRLPSLGATNGFLELGVQDQDGYSVEGAVDLTFIEDQFGMRIAGRSAHRGGGFFENTFTNDFNDRFDEELGRVVFRVAPTPEVDIRLQVDTYEVERAGSLRVDLDVVPDPYSVAQDTENRGTQDQTNILLTLDWDFGWTELAVIANHRERQAVLSEDLDQGVASPGPFDPLLQVACIPATTGMMPAPAPPNQTCLDFQSDDFDKSGIEARLQGDIGTAHWIVGADYFDATDIFANRQTGRAANAYDLLGTNDIQSVAYFGGVEIAPAAGLSLGLEVRRTDEDKDSTSRAVSIEAPAVPGAVIFDNALVTSFSETTWTAFGRYEFATDKALYARVGSGFRSGGLNIDARDLVNPTTLVLAVVPDTYDPERALSYEAGIKTIWFDGGLRADFTVFYIEYEDILQNLNNGDVTPALYPAGTRLRSSSNAPDGRSSSSSFSVHRAA